MTPRDEAIVRRLGAVAGDAEPPALEPGRADGMIDAAMAQARLRTRRRHTRRNAVGLAAAAAVLVGAVGVVAHLSSAGGEVVAVEQSEPLHMELPTGDRITAAPGARFRLESSEPDARRVSLDRGSVLFEVARLGGGETFVVETPHLRARVLGTVFSIESTPDGSVVRVYEGRVEVDRGGRRQLVRASHRLRSSAAAVEPIDDGGPLAAHAWRAAATRNSGTVPPDETSAPAEQEPPRPTASEEHERPESFVAENRPQVAPESFVAENRPQVAPENRPQVARGWIARGEAERALRVAAGRTGGEWRMVEGDALRALRRFEEAARAYERASSELDGGAAAQAGYLAASVRFSHLDDPAGALAALDLGAADARGSPLEERATALRARALVRLGRTADAAAVARRYLERFPGGGLADWMTAVSGEGGD